VNQTRPRCVNQMGKTHSKPLAARHGRGTAWARHAMCESAFTVTLQNHHRRHAQWHILSCDRSEWRISWIHAPNMWTAVAVEHVTNSAETTSNAVRCTRKRGLGGQASSWTGVHTPGALFDSLWGFMLNVSFWPSNWPYTNSVSWQRN
jgi:hypothetical protein